LEPVAVIALVVALLVAVVILWMRRRPRQDEGMQTFRRHIDALSPEARREVMDRARRHEQSGPAGPAGPTARGGRDDERGPDAAAAGGAADGNG
jgi:hypothetical protein